MKSTVALHKSAPKAIASMSGVSYDLSSKVLVSAYKLSKELQHLAFRLFVRRWNILRISKLPVRESMMSLEHAVNSRFLLRMIGLLHQ
jgi:uncharacterized protein YhbP (UPF0306 family)